MTGSYVHGYMARESERLQDQADTLVELLHADTGYPPASRVLEVGCGVGAQTVHLARRSPGALITAIDHSAASLTEAARRLEAAGIGDIELEQADVFALPYPPGSFDHVFVCFVLEHLDRPVDALANLHRVLKPGGSITVIEGDHGSAYFHPDSEAARGAISCQVALQQRSGGDALIGRRLYPLLTAAGFGSTRVHPRMVYVDTSRPELVDGFVRHTFAAMIEGVRDEAISAGMIDPQRVDTGVRDLYRTTETDGVFCYCFFQAAAHRTGAEYDQGANTRSGSVEL